MNATGYGPIYHIAWPNPVLLKKWTCNYNNTNYKVDMLSMDHSMCIIDECDTPSTPCNSHYVDNEIQKNFEYDKTTIVENDEDYCKASEIQSILDPEVIDSFLEV